MWNACPQCYSVTGGPILVKRAQKCQDILVTILKMMIRTTYLKLARFPARSPLPFTALPSISLIPSAPLKLAPFPTRSPLPFAALLSLSLFPSARFTDDTGAERNDEARMTRHDG
jgi:hypothetical protein